MPRQMSGSGGKRRHFHSSKEIDKIDEAWEGMACDILMSAALLFIQFNFN